MLRQILLQVLNFIVLCRTLFMYSLRAGAATLKLVVFMFFTVSKLFVSIDYYM